MRQYRGLTKDGKWVYGWYFELDGMSFIENQAEKTNNRCTTEIIPETVGQQTGRKDNDKTDIYQGDIMEWYNGTVPKGQNPICRTIIHWNNLHSRYEGIVQTGRIIGNIHQNSELLENPK